VSTTKKQLVEEFRCREIRDAAMRVVGRKGLEKATVDDIAREAGVAKGTVYLYFKSRDEVIERTIGAAVDELLARLERAAEGAGPGPFAEALERVLTAQFAYFDENRDFFRLYFASGEYSEERRLRQSRRYRLHLDQLVALIKRGRRRGELKGLEPERTAIAIAGAARDLILRRLSEREPPPAAADARFLGDLLFSGLVARRESA
jgi:TetR/AcrR family transcriptional regulator, fatty acid metabolism regulator protein